MGSDLCRRLLSLSTSAILFYTLLAVAPTAAASADPQQAFTAAEAKKINEIAEEKGDNGVINKKVSDGLGMTKNDETVTSHAFAVKDSKGNVHQIQPLPNDRGYMLGEVVGSKFIYVYWANKDFGLISAVSFIRGQSPKPMANADAQAGIGYELTYWASWIDKH
jgi:hypothetical protein